MTTNTPRTKAQAAAHELYSRTHDATKQLIDTVSQTTGRLSDDVSDNARDAVESVHEARQRVRTQLKAKAEPTAEQVSGAVNELITWARRNGERLIADLDEFRHGLEVRLAPVTVVTRADLAELEARVAETEAKLAKAMRAATTSKAKATPKARSAKKAPATKAAGKG